MKVNGTDIYNFVIDGLVATEGGRLLSVNTKGKASKTGLVAHAGGLLHAWGTHVGGNNGSVYEEEGAMLRNDGTLDLGTATPPTPPTPPPPTNGVWTSTSSNNWSTSGYWSDDGAKQGEWGYGRRTGYWFFGTTLSSALTGKTIKSMTVTLKRAGKGGYSSSVPVYIRWHSLTSQPSGAPSDLDLSTESTVVNLAWGASDTVSLPSTFFTHFQSGTAKGIGIYYPSDADGYYAVMDGQITVKAQY